MPHRWPVSVVDLEFTYRRPRSWFRSPFTWLGSIATDCDLTLASCLLGSLANVWLNHQALLSWPSRRRAWGILFIEDIVCEDRNWESGEYGGDQGPLSQAGLRQSWANSRVEGVLVLRGENNNNNKLVGLFVVFLALSLVALWRSIGSYEMKSIHRNWLLAGEG